MTAVADIELEGRQFALSNLDKVLWPEAGFTKGDMIEYYVRVAPALLPHLGGRPLTLRRFPDGVGGDEWYQFQWPRGHPPWLRTITAPGRSREAWNFCLVEDVPSLVWAANLAAVELHPLLSRGDRVDEPTAVVFDLDPGPPADLAACARVALEIRDRLAEHGLASFPKTSGSLGLHVYVPLARGHSYAGTKAFARDVARRLAAEHPGEVTTETKRSLREGKVLVDWLQNNPTRSTVAPYSLRATSRPAVSTPLAWEEVERGELAFGPADVLDRLERVGDLFHPVLELAQALPG